MPFRLCRLWILLIGLLAVVMAPSVGGAEEKVYIIGSIEGSTGHAVAMERLKHVYSRAGLKVRFDPHPAKRSLMEANRGKLDGDVARVPQIEKNYKNLVRVGVPINHLIGYAYMTDKKFLKAFTGDAEELKGKTVGYVRGVRWANNYLKGVDAIAVDTYDKLVKMLAVKRIDVVIATRSSAVKSIAQLGKEGEQILQSPLVLHETKTYHYLNKKNRDIVPRLEDSIRALRGSW